MDYFTSLPTEIHWIVSNNLDQKVLGQLSRASRRLFNVYAPEHWRSIDVGDYQKFIDACEEDLTMLRFVKHAKIHFTSVRDWNLVLEKLTGLTSLDATFDENKLNMAEMTELPAGIKNFTFKVNPSPKPRSRSSSISGKHCARPLPQTASINGTQLSRLVQSTTLNTLRLAYCSVEFGNWISTAHSLRLYSCTVVSPTLVDSASTKQIELINTHCENIRMPNASKVAIDPMHKDWLQYTPQVEHLCIMAPGLSTACQVVEKITTLKTLSVYVQNDITDVNVKLLKKSLGKSQYLSRLHVDYNALVKFQAVEAIASAMAIIMSLPVPETVFTVATDYSVMEPSLSKNKCIDSVSQRPDSFRLVSHCV